MSHTCPIGRAAWIKLTYTERSRDENQHLPGISRHGEQKEMVPEAKEKKQKRIPFDVYPRCYGTEEREFKNEPRGLQPILDAT